MSKVPLPTINSATQVDGDVSILHEYLALKKPLFPRTLQYDHAYGSMGSQGGKCLLLSEVVLVRGQAGLVINKRSLFQTSSQFCGREESSGERGCVLPAMERG